MGMGDFTPWFNQAAAQPQAAPVASTGAQAVTNALTTPTATPAASPLARPMTGQDYIGQGFRGTLGMANYDVANPMTLTTDAKGHQSWMPYQQTPMNPDTLRSPWVSTGMDNRTQGGMGGQGSGKGGSGW